MSRSAGDWTRFLPLALSPLLFSFLRKQRANIVGRAAAANGLTLFAFQADWTRLPTFSDDGCLTFGRKAAGPATASDNVLAGSV
jgi:hypothetical protein